MQHTILYSCVVSHNHHNTCTNTCSSYVDVLSTITTTSYPTKTYGTLIECFSKEGNFEGATFMWNRMTSSGCKPNVVVYAYMVVVFCRRSMIDRAQSLIDNMVLEIFTPNNVTFNTLIKGLCDAGRVDWVVDILQEMRSHGCPPNTRTYNELLDGLCREGNLEEAFQLFNEMLGAGAELSLGTYNTMIHGFCKEGCFDKALHLVGKMIVNGIQPDSISFNSTIHAYCKAKGVKNAAQILGGMANVIGYRDVFTYTTLISGLSDEHRLDDAVVYLLKMLNEGIFFPNVATWNVSACGVFREMGCPEAAHSLEYILGWWRETCMFGCQFSYGRSTKSSLQFGSEKECDGSYNKMEKSMSPSKLEDPSGQRLHLKSSNVSVCL